jgi:hypothetical protein
MCFQRSGTTWPFSTTATNVLKAPLSTTTHVSIQAMALVARGLAIKHTLKRRKNSHESVPFTISIIYTPQLHPNLISFHLILGFTSSNFSKNFFSKMYTHTRHILIPN